MLDLISDTTNNVGTERLDFLTEEIGRNGLRYHVGRDMGMCPCCGESTDCREAILLVAPSGAAWACARCSGRMVGSYRVGRTVVYDGRTLWAPLGANGKYLRGKARERHDARLWRIAL